MVEKRYLVLGLIDWEGYVELGEFNKLKDARQKYENPGSEFKDVKLVRIIDEKPIRKVGEKEDK